MVAFNRANNFGVRNAVFEQDFPKLRADDSDAPYRVRIVATLIPGRSSWSDRVPRIEYFTQLIHIGTGEVLAFGQDHSDRVYTPLMLERVQNGRALRTISQIKNPKVATLIANSNNTELQRRFATSHFDEALKLALQVRAVHPVAPLNVDYVCDTHLGQPTP
jgi:hypothetical protein